MRDDSPNLPPQNLQAERSVLGAMLLSNACIDDVAAILKGHEFYTEAHQTINREVLRMREAGHEGIDAVTLSDALAAKGLLGEVGGPQYILELLESVPHAAHAKFYADAVKHHWRDRALIAACTEAIRCRRDQSKDWGDVVADVDQQLRALLESEVAAGPKTIADVMPGLLQRLAAGRGTRQSIPTGLPHLDNLTGGLERGRVIVIGARPSAGKTAIAGKVAFNLATAGVPTLFVSLEQQEDELASRFLSLGSRVPLSAIMRGELDAHDLETVTGTADILTALPLVIDHHCPDELALSAMIRLEVRRRGVQVVIVDYLQLVDPRDKKLPREQQVSGISRGLKRLAMQTGVAVIVLSQLNREVEHRDGKRPRLADLRESGSIEQDADQVWLLHRPNRDHPTELDDFGVLEVAKNRNGPTGQLNLGWNKHCAEYFDDGSVQQ